MSTAEITISVTCHCGQTFGLDELDEAQAHVASHHATTLEDAVHPTLRWGFEE